MTDGGPDVDVLEQLSAEIESWPNLLPRSVIVTIPAGTVTQAHNEIERLRSTLLMKSRVIAKPTDLSTSELAIVKAFREVAKRHIPDEAPNGMRCKLLVDLRLGDVRALDKRVPE